MNHAPLWSMLEDQIIKEQYHLKELLGVGGFAGVFRTDEVIKDTCVRVIATKLIPIDNVGNSDKQLQELQAGLSCDHPNLLRCYGAGETNIGKESFLYLLMELGEETLQQRLERGNISTEESIAIFKDITEGLIYFHQKNQVHLDLKPANILKINGKWKIGDYGLVRSINPAQSYIETVNSVGTPLFVPPESYQNIISSAWDIWSLGIIFTILLTEKYPIKYESPHELQEKIINIQLDNLELDSLDQYYRDIIQGCLIKDRQKRLTAQQVKNLLPSVNKDFQSFIPSNIISNSSKISRRTFLITAGLTGIGIGSGVFVYARPKDIENEITSLVKLETFKETLPSNVILEMTKIPAGTFLMGSAPTGDSDARKFEKPQHEVEINKFYLGKYPITHEQYLAVMKKSPYPVQEDSIKNPVENVTWDDAQEFCRQLSSMTRKDYRLPSEAEWEYACRAETTTPFYFGNNANLLNEYAWYVANSQNLTHPVGQKKPNKWGLYDMYGNVAEWCQDGWHDNYIGAPIDGSVWNSKNLLWNPSDKIMRGGSYFDDVESCRSADRGAIDKTIVVSSIGFRVAVSFTFRTEITYS